MHADELGAGAHRDARGAAHEVVAARRAGERDEHPLLRLPALGDVVAFAVLLQVLVDAIGDPEQRELAQRREVPDAEVVGQRGVDAVGRVDVAVGHPAPQRLGAHVDQLDLVGGPHDLVGNRLALGDSR